MFSILFGLNTNFEWQKHDLLGFDPVGDSKNLDITSVFQRDDIFRLQFMDLSIKQNNEKIWILLNEESSENNENLDLPFINPFSSAERSLEISEFSSDIIQYIPAPESNRIEFQIPSILAINGLAVIIAADSEIIDSYVWNGTTRGDIGNAAFVHHGNQGFTYSAVFYGEEPMENTGFDEILELHQSTGIPGNFHLSGTLMGAAEWHNPEFNDWMNAGVMEGWAAMLTSAYGQHIMPFMYDDMNNWSVAIETDMVEFLYGYVPKVAWIPERVWLSPGIYPDAGVVDWLGDNFEQHGVNAVLLDDWPHLNGYSSTKIHWMNNSNGITLRVIPINGSFTGNVHYNPGEAINQIQSGQYEILVYGTDWEVVAEMNEHNGGDFLENYTTVIDWCAQNYPGVDVWKLDNALGNADFNGGDVDITNGNYQLIGGVDGYGGGNNGWYTDWANTASLSDFHFPDQWTYGYIWQNAYNNLMSSPNTSLSQLGWYTMMTNLHETAWHEYVGGPLSGWEHHYSAHIKNANVYAEVSRWANGEYTTINSAYFLDIDQDGGDELIMHNDKVFAVLEGAGGRVAWLFYADDNGSGYSVVGSDVAYYSETDGDYNEDTNNHMAALSDVSPNQQHEIYNIEIDAATGTHIQSTLSLGSVTKTLSLAEGNNYLDVQYHFTDGTGYIKSGWTPDMLDQIWSGKSHLQRIFGEYASYAGYRNSVSGATAALVLGSGGAGHNFEFEGTLVKGDEIYGTGIFNIYLFAGYTSEPYDENMNKVVELDELALGLVDEWGPHLQSAIQVSPNMIHLFFSDNLNTESVENTGNYVLDGFPEGIDVQSAYLIYGRKVALVLNTEGSGGSVSVTGLLDNNGNMVDPEYNSADVASLAVNPHLVGSINNWDAANHDYDFTLNDNGVWELVIDLPSGEYTYKVLESDEWDNDWPGTDQVDTLDTPTEITFLANCGFHTGSRDWDEFVTHTSPIIVGDFLDTLDMGNNWDPLNTAGTMNDDDGDGIFTGEMLLPEGVWEYKVVLNQNWDQDTYGGGGNYSLNSDGILSTIFSYDFRQNATYYSVHSIDCSSPGDMNGDGAFNVLDVVNLVNCVLVGNCTDLENGCGGDMNSDGASNVLDVVTLVNCVLAGECS